MTVWFRSLHDKEAEVQHPEWCLKKTEPGGGNLPEGDHGAGPLDWQYNNQPY